MTRPSRARRLRLNDLLLYQWSLQRSAPWRNVPNIPPRSAPCIQCRGDPALREAAVTTSSFLGMLQLRSFQPKWLRSPMVFPFSRMKIGWKLSPSTTFIRLRSLAFTRYIFSLLYFFDFSLLFKDFKVPWASDNIYKGLSVTKRRCTPNANSRWLSCRPLK